MHLQNVDKYAVEVTITQLIEELFCVQCNKYYIEPEIASCGHSLCHLCWKKKLICPFCNKIVHHGSLKLNLPLKEFTEHCHTLCNTLKNILNINLPSAMGSQSDNDQIKHVTKWLEESQNVFSEQFVNSQPSQQIQTIPKNKILTCKAQIHTHTNIAKSSNKISHLPVPQYDWDKIEVAPETHTIDKNKENAVDPMEPFDLDFPAFKQNLRRSGRKKTTKDDSCPMKLKNKLSKANNSNKSINGKDKVTNNSKQNWNSVKKMRKEFGKVNRSNSNKLNVSIEMCKKKQSSNKKSNMEIPKKLNDQQITIDKISDNTPIIDSINTQIFQEVLTDKIFKNQVSNGNNDENQEITVTDKREDNFAMDKEVIIVELNKVPVLSSICTDKNTSESNVELTAGTFPTENVLLPNNEQIPLQERIPSNTEKLSNTLKVNKVPFFKKSFWHPKYHERSSNSSSNFIKIYEKSVLDNYVKIPVGALDTFIIVKEKTFDKPVILQNSIGIQTTLCQCKLAQSNNTSNSRNITDLNGQIIVENKSIEELNLKYKEKQIEPKLIENEICTSDNVETNTITTQSNSFTLNISDVDIIKNVDVCVNGTNKKNDNIQLLKYAKHSTSEIIMPTLKMDFNKQKRADKRGREIINSNSNDSNYTMKKKKKTLLIGEIDTNSETIDHSGTKNSQSINYGNLMSQVFANIDADINDIQKTQNVKRNNYCKTTEKKLEDHNSLANEIMNHQNNNKLLLTSGNKNIEAYSNNYVKASENIFSIMSNNNYTYSNEKLASVLENVEELTPVAGHDDLCESHSQAKNDLDDESDKSVVEDTPQKLQSLSKSKQKYGASEQIDMQAHKLKSATTSNVFSNSDKSIKNNTIIECKGRQTLETPINIKNFVNQITYKSTPLARKSLSFNKQTIVDKDLEQTLCPSMESIVKNTQEKEFMLEAFEDSPDVIKQIIAIKENQKPANKALCVAGSVLNPDELKKLKHLCHERKWAFVDKYTNGVTHLVVSVDEELKSSRTVKYMRALAAGKWIVSYEWVQKCLMAKKWVDEEQYEAIDSTGHPGPRRSRLAKTKLFKGITFFCMPPFSIFDIDSLKNMLEDAGGLVVNDLTKIRVTDRNEQPCILLAEPENTEVNGYTYLAIEANIVPVNLEWVLNCLGGYMLSPIQELLLCPQEILPKATSKWPSTLFTHDSDL